MPDRRRAALDALPVVAITALAAALRFATLDGQSFGHDEVLTVRQVLEPSLVDTLQAVPARESTPPLYYVLAWVWTRVFGEGEVGVRSLSALAGTAAVPVMYAAGRALMSRRVGLIAALLIAVHPMMVWYSQEARAYSLLVLGAAASLLFFGRSLERATVPNLVGWAAASTLAFATHYFAAFLIALEGAVLLAWVVPRSRAVAAVAGVGIGGLALAPLVIVQADGRVGWIEAIPLDERMRDIGAHFVSGISAADVSSTAVVIWLAGAAAAILLAVTVGSAKERRCALLGLGLGVGTVAAALLAAALGKDYVLDRNVIVALVPLAIGIAAGLGVRRAVWAGPLIAIALAGVALIDTRAIAIEDELQRADWRTVAESIPADGRRRLVVGPANADEPLLLYRPGAERFESVEDPPAVSEVVVLGWAEPTALDPPLPTSFHAAERRRIETFGLAVFRSSEPVPVDPETLTATEVGAGPQGPAAVLVE